MKGARIQQHFLLSAKARTLSLKSIARMSDDEAYVTFRAVRFAETGGQPACPHPKCEKCTAVYEYAARRIFKCQQCERQFSITSGTIFASRKLSFTDILLAIALFVNGANGHSALRMGRDLDVSYKTAFVLLHKIREVMTAMRIPHKLTGRVEIDGKFVGGFQKPPAKKTRGEERRKFSETKRQCIVTMRETRPGGRTLTFVFKKESEAIAAVLAHVDKSARVRTNSAPHWLQLGLHYEDHLMVNHSVAYWQNGIHTNFVESSNSRYRRAEFGVHHHIAGPHLQGYADEFAWREDHRRVSNGVQFSLVARQASAQPVSRDWKGYWQRRAPQALVAA